MVPITSGRCAIVCLPYEMKSMIFAELSDDPSAIVALAKTCTQFYTVYYKDKEARFRYAKNLAETAIGFYSPTILRLGLLNVKFASCTERQPAFRDYIIYCSEHWEFTASDFKIVRSGKFEDEIRKAHQGAGKAQEIKARRLRKAERRQQNANSGKTSPGLSQPRVKFNVPIGVRAVEVRLAYVFWDRFGQHLRPRVSFLDFFYHRGPAFRHDIKEKKDLLGAVVRSMAYYGYSYEALRLE
ncbi:hypothetical protein F5B21DRAFT_194259 [Xylaria acuta]|nr:hypothetical protein F5B21DRAFT_194259 [Xylaria acuta]